MEFNIFYLLLSAVILFIYGSICIISLIFTFSIDTYTRMNERLNLNLVSNQIVTPLDISIDWFDNWAIEHNRLVGPFLVFLSLVDLRLSFELINISVL